MSAKVKRVYKEFLETERIEITMDEFEYGIEILAVCDPDYEPSISDGVFYGPTEERVPAGDAKALEQHGWQIRDGCWSIRL